MLKRFALAVCGGLFLFVPLSAFSAGFLDQAKQDFKPLAGVVVMPVGEEYLIDLDAGRGVVEGDLFSVVVPGERVVHPVTNEVLGTLDRVKGFLQVTKVRSGYSYARPVGKETAFTKGDAIRRFDNVKAAFWDYSGDGQALFAELRAALPTLAWQSYNEAQAQRPESPKPLPGGDPPLMFIHQGGRLEVRGASFQVLRSYTLQAPAAAPQAVATTPPAAVAAPVTAPSVAPGLIVAPTVSPESGGIVRAEKSQWAGVRTIEEVDGQINGVEVADFDGDGRLETALLGQNFVSLVRFSSAGRETIARIDLNQADKYLTLDRADLDGNGLPELYVTAVKGLQPASLVLEFSKNQFRVVQQGVGYFLRSVEMPGEGRTLLGQELGNKLESFGDQIFRMNRVGGKLTKGEVFQAPWKIKLFGFSPVPTNDGRTLFADFSLANRLRVISLDNHELWQSSQQYGGSQISFQQPDYSGGPGDSLHDVVIQPRIELGGPNELLVPANGGQKFISVLSDLGPGSIHALQWDGSALRELWHTRPQEGYLADFRKADVDNDGQDELVMAMVVSSQGMFNKGRTSLVVYELQ